ncbi:extracellular solute-binding protein, partial [Pseudomonas sp. 2822-17]|uniref:extracellular solute-binding protein n=1 Tax=Pseudomonas sp. 2822-17 TaxID=1712678 RepID=UPI001179BB12
SYVDGKLYGIPYLRSTPILYMNVDMLKEAGLDPAGPKNWDEFEEYARTLTIPGEQVGISMPVGIWFFEAFVAQAGG